MNLFQRGKKYYVRLNSKRRVSLGTEDEAEAQRLFSKLKKKWLAGKLAVLEDRPPDKTLADFLAEYGEHSCRTKARGTWRSAESAFKHFLAFIGPATPLAKIGRKDLDTFLARLTVQKSSKNLYFRHLRAAFNQAVAWGYLKTSPCQGLKEARVQKHPPRYLSQEEITRLLAAETDPRFSSLWKFLLLTGCRRNEALQLQARDINWERREIHVKHTKTGAAKIIRLTQALSPVLADIPQVGRLWPWHEGHVSAHFKLTAQKAGLEKVRLHELRHTFASHLVMAGVDLYTVKNLLDHASITTTQIYAHLSRAHLDEALAKLSINDSGK